MENIEALQAIERGEKPDQDTLQQLHQAKLIEVNDVPNIMQLSGHEFRFVGFTPEGLRFLKQSKVPLVTDEERKIIRMVVRGFLDQHEATSARTLLSHFKSPIAEALHRLVDRSVLTVVNNTYLDETYLPRASAFYHCGDSAALAFARKSTELVLRVLRDLFDRELESGIKERKLFTREEVENEARKIDSSIEPNAIFIGLYLAQEFSVFTTIQGDPKQVNAFSLGERIYNTREMDWDEHMRKSNVSLVRASEQRQSPGVPSDKTIFDVRNSFIDSLQIHTEEEISRKVFLVHGHAEEPKQIVAAFLRSLGLEVVILHEQPNQGRTIIEKLEEHSAVSFAVVLLTPDDVGAPVVQPDKSQKRARQNVIWELGFFVAKLGRKRVCTLYVEGVELPSDYQGVLYVPYDDGAAWCWKLVTELSAAGIEVDSANLKKVLSEQPTETKRGSEVRKRTHVPNVKLDHATIESKVSDPMAERRWNRVRDEISKLPEYNREGLRLLLEYHSLTDYTALQKLGQLARQNSLASVLPGLQNQTGLIRAVPGQPPTRQPEYELSYEITPELRPFVERYFHEMQ
jgi:predicted nucleotide-binding protein with TIR-like domain